MNEENWRPLDLHGALVKGYITPERYAEIISTGEIAVRNRRRVVNGTTAERHPIWRAAVEDGWIGRYNNEGYDAQRAYFLREIITEALQQETAADGGLASIQPASALTLISTEPPPLDFVLGGFLRGSVGILTAPGSTGKSFFALELALDIASGADLLQLYPTVGRVTYLSLEDGLPVLHHRIHAIGRHIPANCRTHIDENLQLLPCLGTRIDMESEAETVMERCRDHRLIIIDTLSKAHSYEENSNSEMSRLMVTLDRIALTTGAGVLFLHHVAKGAEGSGQHAARGASAITDNARWAGFLQRLDPETAAGMATEDGSTIEPDQAWQYVRFNASKVNYGPMQEDRWFHRAEDTGVLLPVTLKKPDTADDAIALGGKRRNGKRQQVKTQGRHYDYTAAAEEGIYTEGEAYDDHF